MKQTIAVVVGAVVLLVGLPGVASAQLAGNQDFLVVFAGTTPGSPGLAVATGAFTGRGTVVTPEGQRPTPFPAVFTFPEGNLFSTVTPSHDDLEFNPQTCLLSGPIFGTYQITGGTGQFVGATGSGTFQGQVFLLFGRDAQGQCISPDSGQAPIVFVQVIRNPGTISVPAVTAA